MTPEMRQMIDEEVEKGVQQRLKQDEQKTEVRKRLNFQDEDDDQEETERKRKESYDQRLG